MPASRDVLLQTDDLAELQLSMSSIWLEACGGRTSLIGLEAGGFRLYLDRGPA